MCRRVLAVSHTWVCLVEAYHMWGLQWFCCFTWGAEERGGCGCEWNVCPTAHNCSHCSQLQPLPPCRPLASAARPHTHIQSPLVRKVRRYSPPQMTWASYHRVRGFRITKCCTAAARCISRHLARGVGSGVRPTTETRVQMHVSQDVTGRRGVGGCNVRAPFVSKSHGHPQLLGIPPHGT